MGRASYKREMGALSSASAFNHERMPMLCLQQLNALKANNWTNNNVQWSHQWLHAKSSPDGTQTLNATMSPWAWYSLWYTPH